MNNLEDFDKASDFIENKILYNKYLGIKLCSMKNGNCEIYLPFKMELLGDPFRETIHGGVLSSLMDLAGGIACFSSLLKKEKNKLSTVNLRVDFLEPANKNNLICKAEVIRMGNKISVAKMNTYSIDLNKKKLLIAIGIGTYNVIRENIA